MALARSYYTCLYPCILALQHRHLRGYDRRNQRINRHRPIHIGTLQWLIFVLHTIDSTISWNCWLSFPIPHGRSYGLIQLLLQRRDPKRSRRIWLLLFLIFQKLYYTTIPPESIRSAEVLQLPCFQFGRTALMSRLSRDADIFICRLCCQTLSAMHDPWHDDEPKLCGRLWLPFFRGSHACWFFCDSRVETFFSYLRFFIFYFRTAKLATFFRSHKFIAIFFTYLSYFLPIFY